MKKMRLLLLSSFVAFGSMAQTNLDLQTWSDLDDPTDWSAFLNPLTILVGDTSVVRDAGSVGYGARLTPVDLASLGVPNVYASLLSLGADGAGVPQDVRLDSVYFDAKLSMVGIIDQVGVQVVLTKFNGTTTDTIGMGEMIFNGDIPAYTRYGIEITYSPLFSGIQPDSVGVAAIIASQDAMSVGSSFWVDQFEFIEIDYTGLTVLNSEQVIVYPTVVSNEVTIAFGNEKVERVVILDVAGRLVANVAVNDQNALIWNAGSLQNGTYLVNVMADEFTLLKQSKIIVQH